ncbi:bifunctional (p)ppGpp synthetase/guanosine-3',5'-bis(diphosphate) 3'-pyrophosphohydrolase [Rhodoblastus acidophilus]|uniref:GTP pyrophosphokinase rsh n=1 Tax=Candidatus Rhodoblastus alkanivorans TaxID=2954117 RepID=A0ABS9Z5S2_9HYPH|nr:bifunctional (p)ppGpp synthetase/guanosine-3',5'-bis(diphosphate) 3'-pyrophosphohydrolase [Candidatus Rhodoblastus alkanivorans]MCI4680110.1 bifunctional (p)ppGpp synthetase/guanosine-3',5'-bis(diphosphate) 3'-pyrophosphohydrolase [Candidatus Rhodoblastus alkanivorans]MCI4682988.1 bifunctional (p)ppGpp synthetase/guanosine-3',5'-bis(diphosphate) 3'-pyrophosphohydrolase [Candidatus Rhodoblastus alkanivorans]MDI4640298.1 bifunctional (p)ppGpp synthetase/guanosine-3',5'-bis(diphosphate) 3'-pyrop
MMRQYELVDRVRKYNPHTDEDLLNRAYVYAMRAHGQQKRASGDPYFTHPLEVAAILTELKLDDATIVAAVLHDTIEDTGATKAEIDSLFGHEIGRLVDGLTKLKKLDLVSKRAAQAENFRKLLLAIAEDVRVLLVKLADRLHNMRTLHYVSPDKRARIAQETLDIYAPLAGRMGMQNLRNELENLSFRYLMPEAFAMVSTRLEDLRETNRELIKTIEDELTEELALRGIEAEVHGRQKQPYSVWSKMERKSLSFEQLSDIFGFRVVVGDVDECYRVIGVVHTKWPMVPGRFKDYISTPKQNDYRSIHTTVVGPGRQRVELQVRTREMHEIARYGIAAHSFYKDQPDAPAPVLSHESSAYQWLKRTIDMLAEGSSPEEFLEHTRLELFHDQVFCFTPKGRLIALPRGATPIDFAYAVHTSVGNSAVGAKINGRIAPLLAPLDNGDEVEIVRAEGQIPPAAWETIAVTGKARAAIRRATRDAVRAQYAGLGRQIVLRAFERAGKKFSEDKLRPSLPRLAHSNIEDVLAAVGRGEMFSGDVVKAVYPDFKEERKAPAPDRSEPGWFRMQKAQGVEFKSPHNGEAVPIRGLQGDLPVSFAPNGAVPGDRIVGIMTPGEGITVYPIQSPALEAFDDQPERWLDVRWDVEDAQALFPARIMVAAINEPGSLGAVAALIGEQGANIDDVKFNKKSPDFREISFDVQVFDLKHLNDILSRLRMLPMVHSVERVIG